MAFRCVSLIVTGFFVVAASESDFEYFNGQNLTEIGTNNLNEVLLTCCPLDLSSKTVVKCSKFISKNGIHPLPSSFTIPPHLMAENASITFKLNVVEKPGCYFDDMDIISLNLNNSFGRGSLFLRNGYLKVEKHYYHSDEYCISGKNGEVLELRVCPQNCKGPRPCIVKCCGLHQVYNFGFSPNSPEKGCQNPGKTYFSPVLNKDFLKGPSNTKTLAPHFIERYPSNFKYECHENRTALFLYPRTSQVIANFNGINFTGLAFKLRNDGSILYQQQDGTCSAINPLETTICIDGIMHYGPELEEFSNREDEMVLFLCNLSQKEGVTNEGGYLYGGLMVASSIFLLLTIAVYCMLWERQTVHGWTILSHAISLFFMYIFLGTAHIIRVTAVGQSALNTPGCYLLGTVIHFFFLSTFCWLSMISIDLWLTFRALVPRRGTNSKGYKRYAMYSVLGWGVPAIIVGVGWALTNEHPEKTCSTVIAPGYGLQNCYLQDKALGIYLYFPIAAMIGVNILFFALTSIKLYMYQNSTKMATKDDTQQQFYRLFFKLFFVMGVLYIFEVVSWAVSGNGVFWYWAIFDVLNILRAVAVFIIFVCKPDILWALEQNYPWLKPILIPFACITHKKRTFSQRRAESESVGLNSSLSTKQSTVRSTRIGKETGSSALGSDQIIN